MLQVSQYPHFGALTRKQRRLFPKSALKQAGQMGNRPDLRRLEAASGAYEAVQKDLFFQKLTHNLNLSLPIPWVYPQEMELLADLREKAAGTLSLLLPEERTLLEEAVTIPQKLGLLGALQESGQRFRDEFVKKLAEKMS